VSKLQKAFKQGWKKDLSLEAQPLTFNSVDIEHEPVLIEKKGKAIIGKWNIYEAFIKLPEEEKLFLLEKLVEILKQCNKIRAIAEEVFKIKV
jgi:hypothetical protein